MRKTKSSSSFLACYICDALRAWTSTASKLIVQHVYNSSSVRDQLWSSGTILLVNLIHFITYFVHSALLIDTIDNLLSNDRTFSLYGGERNFRVRVTILRYK